MNYREMYEERKEAYLRPTRLRSTGSNAAWIFPTLFYKSYDWWYIPGGARAPIHTIEYEKYIKVNYKETDPQKLADSLIDAVKKDFTYWKYEVLDKSTDKDYSEIVVFIYEDNSFFCKLFGYKYRYIFIRQEPYLKFYSVLYNDNIYEGTKEELIAMFEHKNKFLASASFYWKEKE